MSKLQKHRFQRFPRTCWKVPKNHKFWLVRSMGWTMDEITKRVKFQHHALLKEFYWALEILAKYWWEKCNSDQHRFHQSMNVCILHTTCLQYDQPHTPYSGGVEQKLKMWYKTLSSLSGNMNALFTSSSLKLFRSTGCFRWCLLIGMNACIWMLKATKADGICRESNYYGATQRLAVAV